MTETTPLYSDAFCILRQARRLSTGGRRGRSAFERDGSCRQLDVPSPLLILKQASARGSDRHLHLNLQLVGTEVQTQLN